VLIDIDLEKEDLYIVLVERKGFTLFVDLDYEQIPYFWTSCRMVGHQLSNRRKYVSKATLNTDQAQKSKNDKGKAKVYDTYKNQEVVNLEKEVKDLEKEVLVQVPMNANTNTNASK